MPRTKVNKAAKIRETFEKLGPGARPKDVIADLATAKITVSSAQVSNIKAAMNGHSKNGNGKAGAISIDDLLSAKKFIGTLGSVERAQSVLAALAKL
ncbi:MAG: hypothetical protein WAL88_04220 [Nitrosotalea sp.]